MLALDLFLKSAKTSFRNAENYQIDSKKGKRGEITQDYWEELHCPKDKAKSTKFLLRALFDNNCGYHEKLTSPGSFTIFYLFYLFGPLFNLCSSIITALK